MMRNFALSVGLMLAGCSGGTSQDAAAPEEAKLQPGQWELTTQTASTPTGAKDAAGEAIKPVIVSSCITPDQVEKPQPAIFATGKGTCSYDSFYMANGILNLTMKCEEPGSSVASTIAGTYTATTMEAEVRAVTYTEASQLNTAAKLNGRRVGECTAPPDTAKS